MMAAFWPGFNVNDVAGEGAHGKETRVPLARLNRWQGAQVLGGEFKLPFSGMLKFKERLHPRQALTRRARPWGSHFVGVIILRSTAACCLTASNSRRSLQSSRHWMIDQARGQQGFAGLAYWLRRA